jgi:hypothetical protein
MVLVQNGIVDNRYTCNFVEFVLLIAPSEAASVWHTESMHQTFLTVVKTEDWDLAKGVVRVGR